MLALLSPAKTLDYSTPLTTRKHSEPRLLGHTQALIDVMRTKSVADIAAMMSISDELAALNAQRYADFQLPFTTRNARPAALAFAGDVYLGLAARDRFDERDWTEAQKTVRILSGLYGVLRPLDLMQPYRLEMGRALLTDRGRLAEGLLADIIAVPAAGRSGRRSRREGRREPRVRRVREGRPAAGGGRRRRVTPLRGHRPHRPPHRRVVLRQACPR